MSPRKQLWSDGWDQELADAASATPAPLIPDGPPQSPAPAGDPRRFGRHTIALGGGAIVLVAAIVALIAALTSSGGSAHRPASAFRPAGTSAAAVPTTATAVSPPATSPGKADALGLVLGAASGHRVVVQRVVGGSPAAAVGISGGEELLTINGQPVTAPDQAEALLGKLPLGTLVTLQLSQGATQITAQIQEPGIP